MPILRLLVLLCALVVGVALAGDANPGSVRAGSGGLEPVWAATDSGLWRSLDNGDNWERVRNASGCGAGFVEAPGPNLVVYQSCSGTVWSSDDPLAPTPTWSNEGSLPDDIISGRHDSNAAGVVLATEDNNLAVHRRDPSGSWEIVFQVTDLPGVSESMGAPTILGDTAYVTVSYFVFSGVSHTEVYRSTNAGEAWSLIADKSELWEVFDAVIDPDDHDRVYFADQGLGLQILDGSSFEGPFPFNGRDPATEVVGATAVAVMPGGNGDLLVGGFPEADNGFKPVMKFNNGTWQSVAAGGASGNGQPTYAVATSGDGRLYFAPFGFGNTVYAGTEGGSWSDTGLNNVLSVATHIAAPVAVMVVHGWMSDCAAFDNFSGTLRNVLGLDPGSEYIRCFEDPLGGTSNGYDTSKGVRANARELEIAIADFRDDLALDSGEPVHLVAHSYGGLVSRWYIEGIHTPADGPIGSLSMLGTPNLGVPLASIGKFLLGSLFAQDLSDMDYRSDIIRELISNPQPSGTIYRSEAGTAGNDGVLPDSVFGGVNDCIVALSSAQGNDFPTRDYDLYHTEFSIGIPFFTVFGCGETTLLRSTAIVENVANTILSFTGQAPPPQVGEGDGEPRQKRAVRVGLVPGGGSGVSGADGSAAGSPGPSFTIDVDVVLGEDPVTFAAFWPEPQGSTALSVTVEKPDMTPLVAGPGVSNEVITSPAFADVFGETWEVTAPDVGTWKVTVTGTDLPAEGVPVYIAMMLESDVSAVVGTDSASYPVNGSMVVTASLVDNGVRILGASASAEVTDPSETMTAVALNDNGTDGDATAGDGVYSGTYQLAACGDYRALASLTGATSEGTTTRVAMVVSVAAVAGDAIGDPCDADEDDDGLTDAEELDGIASPKPALGTLYADPFDDDSDKDGCIDGGELGSDEMLGGLRDPLDPWDYYDVYGSGQSLTLDGVIDLPNDILGVIQHFAPQGQPPYDARFDRSPQIGPHHWNRGAPDGVIDLPNDILGVILQFNPNGCD